jgi:TonB-linked SusC/RagA family outer membrane protein
MRKKILLLLWWMAPYCFVAQATPRDVSVLVPGYRVFNSSLEIQSLAVTGKVIDETGVGMPGVNILVKGTSVGTTTDSEGAYAVNLPDANGTLVFSFIGYTTQEVPVGGKTKIDVTMSIDVLSLGEVVVVGYGTQKKSDITGSISSVTEQSLREVPVASVAQALQGRAAGLDIQKKDGNSKPGANPIIRIRGSRSLRASNDPLIVVDGIPFQGSINDINPEDITNVEVLKDASSTAIYGSRGANGVILITTRRGRNSTAPTITYSMYYGFVKNLGKVDVMNGQQFTDLKKWSRIWGTPGKYTGLDDPAFLTDGTFAPQEVESIQQGRSTDWQDLIYKKGIMTNHQVNVSGGSEKTQYALSAGYFKQTGIYPGQSFERFPVKLSVDQQLGSRFKVGVSSLNTYTLTKGEGFNPMGQVLRASPLATPYDPATGGLWGFVPGSANQVWNPLADFVEGAKVEDRKRFGTFTTAYLEAKLIEGLKYKFNAGAEVRSDIYGNFFASATSNNLGGLNTSSNRSAFNTNYTLENLLIYDKTISQNHKINFTGLYSLQEFESRSNQFDNNTIISDDLGYYNPQYGSNLKGLGDYTKWDIISYMGRLNYNFKEKYLLTLTSRIDGSSRLAPGYKYSSFPSAAIAWNVTEESFLSAVPTISNLKVRASYGRVGNAAVNPYQTQGALSPLAYNYGGSYVTGTIPSAPPNSNLGWEYTTTLNIGVDFGVLQNRVTGTVEVYKGMTDDLLLNQVLPPSDGWANSANITKPVNFGKSENKGLDLQLTTINVEGQGRNKFSWTTDFNFFIIRGKVTKLLSGTLVDGKLYDIASGYFTGEPIDAIYDYKKIGIWQNTPEDSASAKAYGLTLTGSSSVIGTVKVEDTRGRDENKNIVSGPDGVINADDRIIVGSNQAKWQGGFTSRMAYRGFDFTVVAFGRVGSTIISRVHNSGFANTYQGNYNNLVADYWTPDNGQNFYPKPNGASTNTPNNSTLGYFDGTYVKIRTLSLGYTLPPSLLDRIAIKTLRIYATANDAFILFSPYRNKYHGIDPEASGGAVGVDTPATYSVLFGLNASF